MPRGRKGCLETVLRPLTAVAGAVAGALACATFLLFAAASLPGGLGEMQEAVWPSLQMFDGSEPSLCGAGPFLAVMIAFPIAGALCGGREERRWATFLATLAVAAAGVVGVGAILWFLVPQHVLVGTLIGAAAGAVVAEVTRRRALLTRLATILLGALLTAGIEYCLPYLGSVIAASVTGATAGVANPIGVAMWLAESAAEE
jgi:hypothetical protein